MIMWDMKIPQCTVNNSTPFVLGAFHYCVYSLFFLLQPCGLLHLMPNKMVKILLASDFVRGLKNNKFTGTDRNEISLFLERAFVRLEAWFQWFNTTQSGIYYSCGLR